MTDPADPTDPTDTDADDAVQTWRPARGPFFKAAAWLIVTVLVVCVAVMAVAVVMQLKS